MPEIVAKFRWYPGDPLIEIQDTELRRLAEKHGVSISLEKVAQNRLVLEGGEVLEEPRDVPLEEIAQTVVTLSAGSEEAFRKAVGELISLYRSPVPVWGLWGSNQMGQDIASEVIEEDDGW